MQKNVCIVVCDSRTFRQFQVWEIVPPRKWIPVSLVLGFFQSLYFYIYILSHLALEYASGTDRGPGLGPSGPHFRPHVWTTCSSSYKSRAGKTRVFFDVAICPLSPHMNEDTSHRFSCGTQEVKSTTSQIMTKRSCQCHGWRFLLLLANPTLTVT